MDEKRIELLKKAIKTAEGRDLLFNRWSGESEEDEKFEAYLESLDELEEE